jgi:hypothetical protein
MKFLMLPFILLLTTINALPISTSTKEGSVIARSLSEVNNRLLISAIAVESIVKVRAGTDLTDFERDIERTAQDLSRTLSYAADQVRRGPDATIFEAPTLLYPLSDVHRATHRCIDAYASAKNVIVSTYGGRDAAVRILNDLYVGVSSFGDAIKAKVPGAATFLPIDHVNGAVKRAIQSYKI